MVFGLSSLRINPESLLYEVSPCRFAYCVILCFFVLSALVLDRLPTLKELWNVGDVANSISHMYILLFGGLIVLLLIILTIQKSSNSAILLNHLELIEKELSCFIISDSSSNSWPFFGVLVLGFIGGITLDIANVAIHLTMNDFSLIITTMSSFTLYNLLITADFATFTFWLRKSYMRSNGILHRMLLSGKTEVKMDNLKRGWRHKLLDAKLITGFQNVNVSNHF